MPEKKLLYNILFYTFNAQATNQIKYDLIIQIKPLRFRKYDLII
jgi:hypothetical protein